MSKINGADPKALNHMSQLVDANLKLVVPNISITHPNYKHVRAVFLTGMLTTMTELVPHFDTEEDIAAATQSLVHLIRAHGGKVVYREETK